MIPPGWKSVRLGTCVSLKTGPFGSALHKSDYVHKGIPVVNPMHIQNGVILPTDSMTVSEECASKLKEYVLRTGDLVLGRRGEMGRCAVVTSKEAGWLCGTGSMILRPAPTLLPEFLRWFIAQPSTVEKLMSASVGSTMVNLNQKILLDLELVLPPLSEQKRIIEKVELLLTQIEECQANLETTRHSIRSFRRSILDAGLTGKLTETWRATAENEQSATELLETMASIKKAWAAKYENHNESLRVKRRAEHFKIGQVTEQTELPDGWVWAELEDTVLMVVDCHNKTAPYVSSGIPLVRTSNIRNGGLVWDDMKYVTQETFAYWSRRCPPEPGDILFTREAPMCEAALVPEDQKLCLGQRTMLLRPLNQLVLNHYLLYAVQDEGFLRRALKFAVGTGVKHLRVADVSKLPIPVPPYSEQQEITKRLNSLNKLVDEVEGRIDAAHRQLEQLHPIVLQKALRGDLFSSKVVLDKKHAVQV